MGASPRHAPFSVSPVAGQKRPAPSLLPAFEPATSSPILPRPTTRLTHASPSKYGREKQLYPTPVPTSSTLVPTSSPPQLPNTRRKPLQRTTSAFSERAPLSAVPSIELSEHGEPTLMGRSSNSSHYQLSTNKLISRVHVRAVYIAANSSEPKKVQIECTGWNGVKVHCQGKAWELMKGDTFTSETEDADIMVDVQDARVLLTWPRLEQKALTPTDSDLDSENSPRRGAGISPARRPYTSPLRQQHRLQSPVSPSPAVQATHAVASGYLASNPPISVPVQVYEDEPEDEDIEGDTAATQATQSTHIATQNLPGAPKSSQDSLSEPPNDFSDNDEENDPIISSFGPYGANLDARMQTFSTFSTNASPEVRRPLNPLKEESISPQRSLTAGSASKRRRVSYHDDISSSNQEDSATAAVAKNVINQLAYSQLSATPLSTLYQSLPAPLKSAHASTTTSIKDTSSQPSPSVTNDLEPATLKSLLERTPCIGSVEREGKDAAGKRLESEYYYIPEMDTDVDRREMVQGLGGKGLRNCRKIHKQYYWRKPK